jgi:cell wall-associated protease
MGEWKKSFASIGLSAGLLAGAVLAPVNVLAESKGGQKVSIASSLKDHRLLKDKLEAGERQLVSEDTLIIKYKGTISAAEHKRMGSIVIKQIADLNYSVVKVQDKKKLHEVIGKYQKNSKVQSVSPAVMYKPLGLQDPKLGESYHLTMLQADKAQKLAGKNKVKVAVIDQGVDSSHPDLKGQLLSSYNTVNPMNPGMPDFHGTHVAGIIAAKKDNGVGAYGINPNAQILPIDVFDRGWGASDYAIAQGIMQAVKSGAKVINMSLGGPMKSPIIEEAVKKALAKNITIVAAAGNTGDDTISYPAAYEGVISVSAVDKYKKLGDFSSYGPSIDVAAPGADVYSTIYEPEKKSTFRTLSGTSMASPMVAAAASLLLSKHPNLTPSQVEYILEHTADDLGTAGYDVKFGSGLINLVKALQFDIKKVPSIVNSAKTPKEVQTAAETVDSSKKIVKKGALTKPNEEKWIKFNVKEGEYIQASLRGSSQYDYKMMIHFYSPKGGKEIIDVNKVRENKTEGKLVKAPFTGTVAIGVKDANGSYDDSAKKLSQYELNVEKLTVLPEDESTAANPLKVDALPYDSKNSLTFLGENGDDDYLSFKAEGEEQQVIKITSTGVAGIDSTISVYPLDMIFPEDMGEMSEEEKEQYVYELLEGEAPVEPMHYANSKGRGEGEVLTFTADPGMEYLIKTSSKKSNYYGIYDYYMNYELFEEDDEVESSIYPYSVKVEGKILPPDEDGLPFYDEGITEEKVGFASSSLGTLEQKRNIFRAAAEEDSYEDYVAAIQDMALPYKIGGAASGYLQTFEDEDWFKLEPSETGIYQFNMLNSTDIPMLEIYQVVQEKDEEGTEHTYLNQIGSNISYNMFIDTEKSLYTGLKKGEDYLVKVNTNYFSNQISFSPFQFTSKLIVKNPQDKYEDNDKMENVKDLPGLTVQGNFAMPGDQDVFYLQSKSEQIYGITLEKGEVPASMKKYPKELLGSFYGYIAVIEDKNKNRKVDEEEYNYIQYIEKGIDYGNTFGSFKAEKGKNYILALSSFTDSAVPLSLVPYKLTLATTNRKDEDAGSKVRNNIASKPVKLKQKGNMWEASGYLNAGVPNGDEDWYEFTLKKDSSGKIKLETGIESDGKIALYQNGKLVSSADFYPEGDAEVLSVNLKKGTYQIKINDYFRGSTIKPYKLKVYLK